LTSELLFSTQEEEEEDSVALAEVLTAIAETWPGTFKAADIYKAIDKFDHVHQSLLMDFFCPNLKRDQKPSTKSIGRLLKKHVKEAVQNEDGRTVILERVKDPRDGAKGAWLYKVVIKVAEGASPGPP
jgi:hypothetical protein